MWWRPVGRVGRGAESMKDSDVVNVVIVDFQGVMSHAKEDANCEAAACVR